MDPVTASFLAGAAVQAGPPIIKGIARGISSLTRRGYRDYRRWRDPEGVRRQEILQRTGQTPEEYEYRMNILRQAMGEGQGPQRVFGAPEAPPPPAPPIEEFDPEFAARQRAIEAQVPGANTLRDVLNNMNQAARSGYSRDAAMIGARRGPGRNAIGRTSGELGFRSDALRQRATDLAQNRFKLLSDYANRFGMAEIEAGGANLQQQQTQNQLSNFLQNLQQQNVQGQREGYLGQRGLESGYTNLRNILEGERYQQGTRQMRIGLQPSYQLQQVRNV